MQLTHLDAERRYEKLRKAAIQATKISLDNLSDIDLSLITQSALLQTKKWETADQRHVDWDWINGYSTYKVRYPKHFELAIWKNHYLISLSMGRPTYRGLALRLDVIEATPLNEIDRPQIMEIALPAYIAYATLIKASEIRIMNPINDKVKNYYASLGYTHVAKGDYLYTRLNHV